MLVAARSSHDLAPCFRSISPAMRLISASNHFSLVVSATDIASPMQRRASTNFPSWALAKAKCDNHAVVHAVAPVDRYPFNPALIASTAAEALPVRANTDPRSLVAS